MSKIELYKGDCLCINENIFLEKEVLADGILGWQNPPITIDTVWHNKIGCLIDKRNDVAFLRLVDTDDYNCLEAGTKIEIKFCPFCGKGLFDE